MALRRQLDDWTENVKEYLYPLEAPRRTRTVPMEVLAVGPARSGTESLRDALVHLGFSHVYHGYDIGLHPGDDKVWRRLYRWKWHGRGRGEARASCWRSGEKGGAAAEEDRDVPLLAEEFDAVIGHCAAITDFDAACFARELILAYPHAKVVLNTRSNVDEWAQSCENTIMQLKNDWRLWIRSYFSVELFWAQQNFLRGLWPAFYRGDFSATGKWVLEEHRALIRGSVRAENLLEWSPEDGWEPLCRFLNKPVPNEPFPRGNGARAYAAKIEVLYKGYFRTADLNMLITFLCLASVLTLAWLCRTFLILRPV